MNNTAANMMSGSAGGQWAEPKTATELNSGPVPSAVVRLRILGESLDCAIAKLEQRLAAVLSPPAPVGNGNDAAPQHPCGLAQELHDVGDGIEHAANRVHDMLQRLGL